MCSHGTPLDAMPFLLTIAWYARVGAEEFQVATSTCANCGAEHLAHHWGLCDCRGHTVKLVDNYEDLDPDAANGPYVIVCVSVCVRVCVYVCVYACICMYVCIYIHAYIHTCIHTYIHTYIDRQTDRQTHRQTHR